MFGRNPFRIFKLIIPLAGIWLLVMFIPTTAHARSESNPPVAGGNSWYYTGGD